MLFSNHNVVAVERVIDFGKLAPLMGPSALLPL